ncbi:hypothetical protein [Maritimibacter sp. DP1N21-5]|uniref:hypothetical protein n=1 Tax=Maritimibacter sp. DP1N21-5 TaxID=2836867 RepID=UPI001C457E52|nr:hypothetical protein [Maritimibacter sp. DP1N21-5]MBV7410573.1 hypothetical protein [Maritimibacter sp. DP1N21-5]
MSFISWRPLAPLIILISALVSALPDPAHAQARSFQSEGTDTTLVLGARAASMGGTGTASADDPTAIFYNPALLAGLDRPMLAIDRQANQNLRPFNFAGGTLPLWFAGESGLKATLGIARYTRVHVRSSGPFKAGEAQSAFLRLLLPGISGTYDGDIDSKTLVWRFAMGMSHDALPGFALGVTLDRIDCRTNSCGVHATSNGYEVKSYHAYAWTLGLGASYRFNDRWTIAATVQDIQAEILYDAVVTDALGTRTGTGRTSLPFKFGIEVAATPTDWLRLAAGYQLVRGTYGTSTMQVGTLHLGAEATVKDHWKLRAGVWRPLQMQFTNNIAFNLPPVVPGFGIGYERDGWSLDTAVIPDPLMSVHNGRVTPHVKMTLGYSF